MPAGAMAAVVTERDGLSEGDVEPASPGDGRRHLRDLKSMGEAGALVVVGKDEHLGLAGQAPKRRTVQDAVPVPLKAGAEGIWLLRPGARAGAAGSSRARREADFLCSLPLLPTSRPDPPDWWCGALVGESNVETTNPPAVAGHSGGPLFGSLGDGQLRRHMTTVSGGCDDD